MEELQDAIEDVQYLQAVNSKDTGPTPTEPWPFPSEKALEEFNTEQLQVDRQFYALANVCSGILGLYLVRGCLSQPDRYILALLVMDGTRTRLTFLVQDIFSVVIVIFNLRSFSVGQFGRFCEEAKQLSKYEFLLDVIRYRVRLARWLYARRRGISCKWRICCRHEVTSPSSF